MGSYEPHAGGLLALDVGARGLPDPMYESSEATS
jgi:hypothetical protein